MNTYQKCMGEIREAAKEYLPKHMSAHVYANENKFTLAIIDLTAESRLDINWVREWNKLEDSERKAVLRNRIIAALVDLKYTVDGALANLK